MLRSILLQMGSSLKANRAADLAVRCNPLIRRRVLDILQQGKVLPPRDRAGMSWNCRSEFCALRLKRTTGADAARILRIGRC